MLVQKRIFTNRKLVNVNVNRDVIEQDLRDSFVGHQYYGGSVRSLEVKAIGSAIPSSNKSGNTGVSVEVVLSIFMVPPGFVVANGTVRNIKQDNNVTTYVISGDIGVIAPLVGNTSLSQDNENRIIGLITTMNKSSESLNMYKHLVVGSKVNFVCLANISAEGRAQPLTFSADVIEHVPTKCFTYSRSIDIARIVSLATKQKVDYPLFAKHELVGIVDPNKMVEGKSYCMSIYGLAESRESGIDFITASHTSWTITPAGMETHIGADTLNDYLYNVMLNWNCALKVLANS